MPCFDLASMDTLYLHCSLSLLFTPRRCLLKHSPPDLPTLQYLIFVTFLTPAQCLENLLLRLRELTVKKASQKTAQFIKSTSCVN